MACQFPMWSNWGGKTKDATSRMLLSNAMANLQLETVQNTNIPLSRSTQPNNICLLKHLVQELTLVLQPKSSDLGHYEYPVLTRDIPPRARQALVIHILRQCCSGCHDSWAPLPPFGSACQDSQLPLLLSVQAKGSMGCVYRGETPGSIRPVISNTSEEK